MPIAALLFDLDGTLVDSAPGIEYAAQQALQAILPGQTLPPLRPLLGPPIRQILQRALPNTPEVTLTALEQAFRQAYDGDGWQKSMPFPGVPETLAELQRQNRLCLGVTNKPQLATQKILAHCGLAAYFREFLSPNAKQPGYPNKAAMAADLLQRYALTPAHTALVGDTAEDLNAAQACGLPFAALTFGYGFAPNTPIPAAQWVCAKFADLLNLTLLNKAS